MVGLRFIGRSSIALLVRRVGKQNQLLPRLEVFQVTGPARKRQTVDGGPKYGGGGRRESGWIASFG